MSDEVTQVTSPDKFVCRLRTHDRRSTVAHFALIRTLMLVLGEPDVKDDLQFLVGQVDLLSAGANADAKDRSGLAPIERKIHVL